MAQYRTTWAITAYDAQVAATAPSVGDREIVVAVVTPVGGPVESTLDALTSAFERCGFSVQPVRISELLDTTVPTTPEDKGATRLRRLMNKGDAFRTRLDDDAACGYLASQAILHARRATTGSSQKHRARHVNLVRSLKTPGEIRVLRSVYGQRLIVVGVSASVEDRRVELTRQLSKDLSGASLAEEVGHLLTRDEKDEPERFGQRARDAYRLSDAFVAVKIKTDASVVDRLVDLLLGEPFQTPTRDEQGMFLAWAAKFRSSAAGRQVGAAIVDQKGEVVALGCNDVPRPGGGQYWPDHADDRRDFQLGYDANDRGKFGMARSLLRDLASSGWLTPDKANLDADTRVRAALSEDGPLRGGELDDLIEYGRIVHAEMAALMTAAREGRSVQECTLYTTTYPCHECARLIIAAGITRVCFIDPYSKSRAPELFEAMFDSSGKNDRVLIEPFVGVSPRLFSRVFEMSNRTKDIHGEYVKWEYKNLVMDDEEVADSMPDQEQAVGAYLAARLAETAPAQPGSEGATGAGGSTRRWRRWRTAARPTAIPSGSDQEDGEA